MNARITEFNNILKNEYLRENTEKIINNINSDNLNNNKPNIAYKYVQTLIEYINIKLLIIQFNINLPNYDIIRIINAYKNLDENLYQEMLSINSEYNLMENNNEITHNDVMYLLCHLDSIYGYILETYGNII